MHRGRDFCTFASVVHLSVCVSGGEEGCLYLPSDHDYELCSQGPCSQPRRAEPAAASQRGTCVFPVTSSLFAVNGLVFPFVKQVFTDDSPWALWTQRWAFPLGGEQNQLSEQRTLSNSNGHKRYEEKPGEPAPGEGDGGRRACLSDEVRDASPTERTWDRGLRKGKREARSPGAAGWADGKRVQRPRGVAAVTGMSKETPRLQKREGFVVLTRP